MERESFEDAEVAQIMNQHFVAIKVDREERPDVDQIYMNVCQALTGSGGWPLTIIMTPDQKPFFAGTYFPKKTRFGRMGLVEVLQDLTGKWNQDRNRVVTASEQILHHLRPQPKPASVREVTADLLDQAVRAFSEGFDGEYGGFGNAPKFPTPHNLMFLTRYAHLQQRPDVLNMVEQTLQSMYQGGIHDHVGFGFSRYSTDKKWLVPHFEKMLYDNALLVLAYAEAYQVTGDPLYKSIVEDVLTYILRDMADPEGGFYSAEDADSEGIEGRFYVWSVDEVREALKSEEDVQFAIQYYGMSELGNFEGNNIPHRIDSSVGHGSGKHGNEQGSRGQRVERIRRRLFEYREQRIHPHKDDKILTAWNGLMIAALSYAGRVFDEPRYNEAAERAMRFVLERLQRADGRLLARYRDGDAAHLGYVDDYAFLIWGLIELYETNFQTTYLKTAVELQKQMLDLFWDAQEGGFFLYGEDGERLILRPKEIYDGAMPSGNSVAALNLLRLGRITGDSFFEERAQELLHAFSSHVEAYPAGYSFFLMAVQFALGPTKEIVLTGNPTDTRMDPMITAVQQAYLPDAVVVFHPSGWDQEEIEHIAPYVKDQLPIEGKTTAYICENYVCRLPVTEVGIVVRQLQQS